MLRSMLTRGLAIVFTKKNEISVNAKPNIYSGKEPNSILHPSSFEKGIKEKIAKSMLTVTNFSKPSKFANIKTNKTEINVGNNAIRAVSYSLKSLNFFVILRLWLVLSSYIEAVGMINFPFDMNMKSKGTMIPV